MNKLLTLLALLVAIPLHADNVSVKEFGAKGDGVTLDTEAIQAAIEHVAGQGGGTVCVPAGTYMCGSIWLRSHIELKLSAGAIIKGSPNMGDYCDADCCPQNEAEIGFGDYISGGHLILAVDVQDVTLSGPGRIDGNSKAFMLDSEGKNYAKKSLIPARPSQMVWFVDSKDIRIRDIELADSPFWTCFILNCERVWIDGCYIHTQKKDYYTYNGDGIDIDRSRYVTISNCRIDTSDDCITLRASGAERLQNPQDCAYVTVTNCNISTKCNAIRLGVGEGHIHDAVFSNITISNTTTAFNIVASYVEGCRGTDIDGILFRNIRVQAHDFLRIHHMRSKDSTIKDITFDGISGTASRDSRLWARKAAPFQNIVFRNVDVPALLECVHADVKVEGGLLRKKELSAEETKAIEDKIENETMLLH